MLTMSALAERGRPLAAADRAHLDAGALARARALFASVADCAPTPLRDLPAMARRLGVGRLSVKDESTRCGLGSFKALGGSYAVIALAGEAASAGAAGEADRLTVAAATDGNHGRSVAWGAKLVGARAVIFLHEGVSAEREAAIARFGAETVRVPGTYDDSVAASEAACREHGWTLVSDTSWPGYERIPSLVMEGYTAMVGEALEALGQTPTHVFLQAGVGGLAAAVAGHMAVALGEEKPLVVVVEPERAACLHASALAGAPVKIANGEATVMAMLECYEPSLVAWRVLARAADAFMTVDEASAGAIMNALARPEDGDPAIVSGESGGAGLAGLAAAMADPVAREALGLGPASRILVFNTEGATDRGLYRDIVGLDPDAVASAG